MPNAVVIQINLNNPFHFNIDLFLGCNNGGADGIAFVLQPISTSLGSSGGGLGYAGINPSFSVEFDTWQNSQYADPTYDHIAIQKNGILNHQTFNIPITKVFFIFFYFQIFRLF